MAVANILHNSGIRLVEPVLPCALQLIRGNGQTIIAGVYINFGFGPHPVIVV